MVFMRQFYLIIRFSTRVPMHGGPSAGAEATVVRYLPVPLRMPAARVCNRDWPVRLLSLIQV